MSKRTLVIGVSPNPGRFSYKAVNKLVLHKHETIAVGVREGEVAGVKIIKGFPQVENVHTVTLYINAEKQEEYIDYILGLKPKRIIFNPGTENTEFENLARSQNIIVYCGCTLVLLSANHY